ncbi:hypothetical protein QUF80_03690 [Desulfococcaceae bacterium HSG8]|nr:hypothetical protein [Desulfococcaceae bacterium HSG8]
MAEEFLAEVIYMLFFQHPEIVKWQNGSSARSKTLRTGWPAYPILRKLPFSGNARPEPCKTEIRGQIP